MDANDFFQGGYGDEASLIELVTLVGLEGLLARCGGLDGQLDHVTIFWISIHTSKNQWRVAIPQKVWTQTQILIPNLRYFVAISRFVARFKGFIEQKLLLLRFWKYAQKLHIFANTRPTKKLKAFFASAESLPTSATLNQ